MKPISIVLLAISVISLPCAAGPNRWTPTTGSGVALVSSFQIDPVDPNVAYAITPAGLYKTVDGGDSWLSADVGVAGVIALAIARDRTVFAATRDHIFTSVDGGHHWSSHSSPANTTIEMIVFDDSTRTLIAEMKRGTRQSLADIYITTNFGQTWTNTKTVSAQYIVLASVVVSASGVYAWFAEDDSSEVFHSSNGGRNWERVNAPPKIGALYGDPSTPWLYAWLSATNPSVSKDGGKTWTELPAIAGPRALIPRGTSLFAAAAGVFVYNDGARAWQQIGTSAASNLAVSDSTPRRFYAAPGQGVLTFVEGDRDWAMHNEGLPGAAAYDVDTAKDAAAIAYAATQTGLFRTDDGGTTWRQLQTSASHIAVDPADSATAYMFGGSILKTSDGGATWKEIAPDFTSQLAISRSDPKTLYVALTSGIAKSTDGGDSWQPAVSSMLNDAMDYIPGYFEFEAESIAVNPSNSSNAAVGKYSGVYTTNDGGTSWKHGSTQANVDALAYDPSDTSTIFAGGDGGVMRSHDAGRSWSHAGLYDQHVSSLLISGTHLLAGTREGHIYRSDDRAQTWIGFDEGLLGAVSHIVADTTGSRFYAATSAGVYAYDILNEDPIPAALPEDAGRLPHAVDAVIASPSTSAAFIVPVAGMVRGIGGTLFTTELTLSNLRDAPQDVVMTRVPASSFRLTLPPSGTVKFSGLADRLDNGVASLLVTAVDANGNLDTAASITASTRIWSIAADGRAPTSQSIPSATPELFSAHPAARATGLDHTSGLSRTNVGILNLSTEAHQFTIQIVGADDAGLFTIAVPPFTLVQMPLPDADYGPLWLDGSCDTADCRWLMYGSTIDLQTGQARTSLAVPREPGS